MSDLDRRLSEIARNQRMLITVNDVIAQGGAQHHCDRRVDGGRWQRVDRGVFLLAGSPLDWTTQQLACVLAAGHGAAASHLAATRVWEVPGYGRAGLELSLPRGHRYRRAGVKCHESTDLHLCRIVVRNGVPVTDPDRTLLDLGRYVGPRRLARAVESARRAELVTWTTLIASLAAHARRGRPGVQRLRQVILAGAHREEVTDTDVELLVLGLLTGAGLPEPVVHHRVYDGDRFVAEVDMAYPELMVAIECDGGIHGREDVRERDLPRQNDLILLGWTVVRFTNTRVLCRPDSVVTDVREARATAVARRAA